MKPFQANIDDQEKEFKRLILEMKEFDLQIRNKYDDKSRELKVMHAEEEKKWQVFQDIYANLSIEKKVMYNEVASSGAKELEKFDANDGHTYEELKKSVALLANKIEGLKGIRFGFLKPTYKWFLSLGCFIAMFISAEIIPGFVSIFFLAGAIGSLFIRKDDPMAFLNDPNAKELYFDLMKDMKRASVLKDKSLKYISDICKGELRNSYNDFYKKVRLEFREEIINKINTFYNDNSKFMIPYCGRNKSFNNIDAKDIDITKEVFDEFIFGFERVNKPECFRELEGILNSSEDNELKKYFDKYLVNQCFPIIQTNRDNYSTIIKIQNSEQREKALKGIKSILISLLAAMPLGKLYFTFVDPINLGQSFADFLHLGDYDKRFISDKVWVEQIHIENQLFDYSKNIENIIQEYLRNDYQSIEDYNKEAGEIAEPYRVLVIIDFPNRFTSEMIARLQSICLNGHRCGIHVIILKDDTINLPYDVTDISLEANMNVIKFISNDSIILNDSENLFDFEELPKEIVIKDIIEKIGESSKNAKSVKVQFDSIIPEKNDIWNSNCLEFLSVPIGRFGARKKQEIILGKGINIHALITGATGSGKSVLLNAFITNIALMYSPDEVELYLIDFKEGIEFKIYADNKLPHARVIAIESEREFALSVLQGLSKELELRGQKFKNCGETISNITEYRQKTGKSLPRILLIVDEYQKFFENEDKIASDCAVILQDLINRGRAFGIHIILCSQAIRGEWILTRSVLDQISVRIALKGKDQGQSGLSDNNSALRTLSSNPGHAVYNDNGGEEGSNSIFQVAYLSKDEHQHYIDIVDKIKKQKNYKPDLEQKIFDGRQDVCLYKDSNHPLNKDLSEGKSFDSKQNMSTISQLWIGEPVAICDPTSVKLERQNGNNLLVIGQRLNEVNNIFSLILISILSNVKYTNPSIYILDYGTYQNESENQFLTFSKRYSNRVFWGKRKSITEFMREINKEVNNRNENEEYFKSPVFLIVFGVQRAKDLKDSDEFEIGNNDFYDFDNINIDNIDVDSINIDSIDSISTKVKESTSKKESVYKMFTNIIKNGPDVGVHSILWSDSKVGFERNIENSLLREFDKKILFKTNTDDSIALIDTQEAAKLKDNMAFLYDETLGRLEKFRAYNLSKSDWIDWAINMLDKNK